MELGETLDELEQLVVTAGAEVVARIHQKRPSVHPRTYIGPGKAREISRLRQELDVDLVVLDASLSPSQQNHLAEIIGAKILDRPALILDIFAQRARSADGKLQVELAQLNYLLPRLVGWGIELSRLGAGIGTRGPGETKLEVDRRRVRQRIRRLNRELDELGQHRATQRKQRQGRSFTVSLVGYTNAGKSTLLNRLTNAKAFVEDKLFATLDPTVRRLALDSDRAVVLADTVGFIRSLPPELVAAFRSTLDEVREAQLLLHVIDASHLQKERQIETVEKVLRDLKADEIRRIDVFNKIDCLSSLEREQIEMQWPQAVLTSGTTGEGLEHLVAAVREEVTAQLLKIYLLVPYRQGQIVQMVYQGGHVLARAETKEGTLLAAEVSKAMAEKLRPYVIPKAKASELKGGGRAGTG